MSHVGSIGPSNVTGNVVLSNLFSNSGTATLNGTTGVTVTDTGVTASSTFLITYKTPAGTPGAPYVSAVTASTSFVIKSAASDTSVVQWYRLG